LVGGNLGVLAQNNGWAGIIVNGCVRDSEELNQCDIGIRALATHPRRSVRKGLGEKDLVIDIAGVTVRPGNWVYADSDGILISQQPLS
jgi:regulator of ribonuclease activity A